VFINITTVSRQHVSKCSVCCGRTSPTSRCSVRKDQTYFILIDICYCGSVFLYLLREIRSHYSEIGV